MAIGNRKGIAGVAIFLALLLVAACQKDKSTPATQQPPPPNPGTLAFSTASYSVAENAASASITVTRTGGTLGVVSVDYATSDGTAVAGTHYTAANGTLAWADGESGGKTFSVPLAPDDRATESSQTVMLALSNAAGGATPGTAAATLTILDDDSPGMMGFSPLAVSVNESDGTATINVTRTGGNLGAVSVTCGTTGGTATAGADYTTTSMVLSWADADSAPKPCTVPITDDPDAELAETIQLSLSNPTNGATLGNAGATITIAANDTPTATFLFYQASLHALDPATPSSPVSVDGTARHGQIVPHGLWDGTNDLIRDLHARSVAFEAGGKLFRVGARLRDGAPGGASNAAVQVSNESGLGSGAKAICETRAFADYADHANARFVYRLASTDTSCDTADDVTHATAVGAAATDMPLVLAVGKSVVTVLRDVTNGAIAGWLLYDANANQLERGDPNFNGVTTVKSSVSDHAVQVVATAARVFLDLDGSLYVYDVTGGALTLLFTGTPGARLAGIADQTDLYFLAVGGSAIYRVPLNATSASGRKTVVNEGSGVTIGNFGLTGERVVYVATDASGTKLKSVSRTATFASALTIDDVAGISFVATAGERVYYNITGATPKAVNVRADGTGSKPQDGAQWIGRTFAPDAPIGRAPGLARVLQARGYVAGGAFAGGTLHSIAAQTADDEKQLGIVDGNITAIAGEAIGNAMLLRGVAGGNGEVFSADAVSAGSLQRVTTTSTDEQPLAMPAIPE